MAEGAYFASLSAALREAGVFQPCLVLDRDRLDWNIGQVEKRLSRAGGRGLAPGGDAGGVAGVS